MSIEMIHWCSFCSKNPSDGILTVEDLTGQIMDLNACLLCKQLIEAGLSPFETDLAGNPE